jgi:ribA/ribD-fused uncharacterized protein
MKPCVLFNSKLNPRLSAMTKLYYGVSCKTLEHPCWCIEVAYQAMKCANPEDKERISSYHNGFDAKRDGKSVKIRDDWNNLRYPIMLALCKSAAERNEPIRRFLRDSGDNLLLHYAPWDEYWGTGRYGLGSNMMGRAWMKVREELNNSTTTGG